MAARRLLIILVLLMAASIAAASLAPERSGRGLPASESSTTTSSTTADPDPTGEALTARIDASAAKPETVEAFVGDQLDLQVGADPARTIEIAPFGLIDEAAPDAPAAFDLLLRDSGAVPITDAQSGDIVGRLLVDEATGPGKADGAGTDAKRKSTPRKSN